MKEKYHDIHIFIAVIAGFFIGTVIYKTWNYHIITVLCTAATITTLCFWLIDKAITTLFSKLKERTDNDRDSSSSGSNS